MTLASRNITHRRKAVLPAGNGKARPPGPAPRPLPAAAPADAAFRSLLKTLGLLKRVMEPYFARFGVSGSQWGVLVTLHRCEQEEGRAALRLTELGDRLIVRPPSVTGVVDRLQRIGLVARTASSADHRAKDVSLTAAGRDLVGRILEHHPQHVHHAFRGLSSTEQGDFQRLLDRLSTHLEQLPAEAGMYSPAGTEARRVTRLANDSETRSEAGPA